MWGIVHNRKGTIMATMTASPELCKMGVANWADYNYSGRATNERAFNTGGVLIRGLAPRWEQEPYDVVPQNHLEALAHVEAATAYYIMPAADKMAVGQHVDIHHFSLFTPPAWSALQDYSLRNTADAAPVFDRLRALATPQLTRIPAPAEGSPIRNILNILSLDASDETAALMRSLPSSFLEPVFMSSPAARIHRIALEGILKSGKTDFVLINWRASAYIVQTGLGAMNFQLMPLFTGLDAREQAREVFNSINPLYSAEALRSRYGHSTWDRAAEGLTPVEITAQCIIACLAMSHSAIGTEFLMSPEELAVITGVTKEEAEQAADLAAADPGSGLMRKQSAKDQPVSYWHRG